MTHEPKCFYTGERHEDDWYDPEDDPCICDEIQAAYQRGIAADHSDCVCKGEEAAFYQDGKLQYVFLDGIKFVPEQS